MEINTRLLVVDDNEAIHQDFMKILSPRHRGDLRFAELEFELFEEAVQDKGILANL